MNDPQSFNLRARLKSFVYAGKGIWILLRSQHNAWIHFAATIAVVVAGFGLKISRTEWCLIILSCAVVWAAEAFNTAVEFLADAVSAQYHPLVEKTKDVAAAGVLLTAIGAALVGMIVFVPKIFP